MHIKFNNILIYLFLFFLYLYLIIKERKLFILKLSRTTIQYYKDKIKNKNYFISFFIINYQSLIWATFK